MPLRKFLCALTVFFLMAVISIQAQDTADDPIPDLYLDCQRCDYTYIRSQIDFVNLITEPDSADVHLRITDARTYGGREFTLDFRGSGRFEGLQDTLIYRSHDTESAHSERAGLVRYIRVGLVPFAARTEALDRLGIYYDPDLTEPYGAGLNGAGLNGAGLADPGNFTLAEPNDAALDDSGSALDDSGSAGEITGDPRDGWFFDLNLRGDLTEEESEQRLGLHGGLHAERITDRLIISTGVHTDIQRRSIELTDERIRVNQDRGEFQGLLAFALGDHAALGLYTGARFDRPYNIRLHLEASPAIEYNVFPYGQFRERRLILRYRVAPIWRDYLSETIYSRQSEYLIQQSLHTQLRFDRSWGRFNLEATAWSYFHDPDLNRLELSPSIHIRLIRGLSLTLSGDYRFINDQLFLPMEGLSDLDILTGRVMRPTSYDFRVSAGIAWSFGSLYNHVVNPRFDGL